MTKKCIRCDVAEDRHFSWQNEYSVDWDVDSKNHEFTAEVNLPMELEDLLEKYSAEYVSGTPVHVLSYVMLGAIKTYNEATHRRAEWRGDSMDFSPDSIALLRVRHGLQSDIMPLPYPSLEEECSYCGVPRGTHWYEKIADHRTYQINNRLSDPRHEFVS